MLINRDLSYGKGSIVPIRDGVDLSNIEKQDPWDGKDGEVRKMHLTPKINRNELLIIPIDAFHI